MTEERKFSRGGVNTCSSCDLSPSENKTQRQADTEYVAYISYGKDSLAMLEAIKILNYPLDRVVHTEVWATDDIHADFPEMVDFKSKADGIIKERYGIEVEHICAMKNGEKLTYEKQFYTKRIVKRLQEERIYGFPIVLGAWCNSRLKVSPMNRLEKEMKNKKTVQYLGIACDEPERIARHSINECKVMPLVDIEWDEAYCRKWCEENNLLSPTYENADRGGCWFCHNQGVDQLRFLRKTYPNLWKLLLKWDKDSPVTFKADKHTVADYEKRFQAEDDGKIVAGDKKFRWKQVLEDIESK